MFALSLRSYLDAFRSLSSCPGGIRHGYFRVHARRPRARHFHILRRSRGDSWSPDIGIRRGHGDRRTCDGRPHSSPPREIDTLGLRDCIRGGSCRRGADARLHCSVHHARDRRDCQRRLLGGRTGRSLSSASPLRSALPRASPLKLATRPRRIRPRCGWSWRSLPLRASF